MQSLKAVVVAFRLPSKTEVKSVPPPPLPPKKTKQKSKRNQTKMKQLPQNCLEPKG